MSRRKPPDRIDLPRTSENEKRQISAVPPSAQERFDLARRAWYRGYGKHKRNPYIWGLDAYHGPAPDRTFCEDAGFELADEPRIEYLLPRGIEAGLLGDMLNKGDPTMLWTIDDNGWIYELRLTTPTQAEYHGFPMRPANAFSQKVIARFAEWCAALTPRERSARPELERALRAAEGRYRL